MRDQPLTPEDLVRGDQENWEDPEEHYVEIAGKKYLSRRGALAVLGFPSFDEIKAAMSRILGR